MPAKAFFDLNPPRYLTDRRFVLKNSEISQDLKVPMLKVAFVFTTMLLGSQCTFALTYEQAGENLTYFAYAQQAAAHCKKMGVDTSSTLGAWNLKYERERKESMASIRTQGKSRDLDDAGQNYLVSEVLAHIGNNVRMSLTENGVPCHHFNAWLQRVSRHIKQ